MSVVVVATAVPNEGSRDAVIAALTKAIARVHAEDAGCERYALHTGPDRLVMIEKWATEEDLRTHGAGGGLTELRTDLEGLLSGPLDVQVLTPHPAGTAEQGVI